MPRITDDRITLLPEDRSIFTEQSVGIKPATYTTILNAAIQQGDTTKYFKFLEEIAEKDPDILHSISTRTSYVTSKEWTIEGDSSEDADKVLQALTNIKGDPQQGLMTLDGLIDSMLGPTYLTGISISEIVTDGRGIIGFSKIPSHFLTFNDAVYYPKLYTQEQPTGSPINADKMISHFPKEDIDPVRGWLGLAIGWLYVFKRAALDARTQFQRKYGKGFLLVNMPGDKDSYSKAWKTAEELIENYSETDGAVFPAGVEVDYKEPGTINGDYFFTAEDSFRNSIVKIILGQESTSSSESSNRSTAEVHMEVLERRILEDCEAIEKTLNTQLIPAIKTLLGIAETSRCEFKFAVSEMEEAVDASVTATEETDTQTTGADDE